MVGDLCRPQEAKTDLDDLDLGDLDADDEDEVWQYMG